MRRLEYTRPSRGKPGHARNAGEAVTQLAHMARERHRLEQERATLMRRIRRIDARLAQIATAETRLIPMIQADAERPHDGEAPTAARATTPKPVALPAGVSEVTLRY